MNLDSPASRPVEPADYKSPVAASSKYWALDNCLVMAAFESTSITKRQAKMAHPVTVGGDGDVFSGSCLQEMISEGEVGSLQSPYERMLTQSRLLNLLWNLEHTR